MGLTKVIKIIYIFILVIVGGFASEVKAYYASTVEEGVTITTGAYEDLVVSTDKTVYGSCNQEVEILLSLSNPNDYVLTYNVSLNNGLSYEIDGTSATTYTINGKEEKTHTILISENVDVSELTISVKVTLPYSQDYTKTINLDGTCPVCTFGNWSSSSILTNEHTTITLTCSDTSGIANNSLSSNAFGLSNGQILNIESVTVGGTETERTFTITVVGLEESGTGTISLLANKVLDNSNNGNVAVESSNIEVISDIEAPIIEFTPSGNEIASKTQSIVVNLIDSSDVVTMKYLWSQTEGASAENGTDFASGTTITKDSGDGIWYLCVYAKDSLGYEINACSEAFVLDNTAPSLSVFDPIFIDKDSTAPLSSYVSASDAGSGIDQIKVIIDGIEHVDTTTLPSGEYSATYTAIDKAGNSTSKETNITIYVDLQNRCEDVTTTEDNAGLYKDFVDTTRCIYRGGTEDVVNNWVQFRNDATLWRIVGVESDGAVKIIKNDPYASLQYHPVDNSTSFSFAKAGINTTLRNSAYNAIDENDREILTSHTFNYGTLGTSYRDGHTTTVGATYNKEKDTVGTWTLGLPTATDYVKASTLCDETSNWSNTCPQTAEHNWMYRGVNYWIINIYTAYNSSVDSRARCVTNSVGGFGIDWRNPSKYCYAYPVTHFKNTVVYIGSGTEEDPYIPIDMPSSSLTCTMVTTSGYETSKELTIIPSDSTLVHTTESYSFDNTTWGPTNTQTISSSGVFSGYIKDTISLINSCSIKIVSRKEYRTRTCTPVYGSWVLSKTEYSETQYTECRSKSAAESGGYLNYYECKSLTGQDCAVVGTDQCFRRKVYSRSCSSTNCSDWGPWTTTSATSGCRTKVQTRTTYAPDSSATTYQDLTITTDKASYGGCDLNQTMSLTIANNNSFDVTYTLGFNNTDLTYTVDGIEASSYTLAANSSVTHAIVMSGGTRETSLDITVEANLLFKKTYTKTVALDYSCLTCSFGEWSSSSIFTNETATIPLVCSDVNGIETETLTSSALTLSDANAFGIESITTSGSETERTYLITVRGGSEGSSSTITLKEDSVLNSWGSGNKETTSTALEIAIDVEEPVGSIVSTNNTESSQTVTINMTDNIGVSAYYFGTNSNPGISDYTEIETTTLAVINETVSNNGTYYLFVKDVSGNIYNTSVDFYKVILESTGGSVNPASIVAMSGNEISLPIPTSSSKEFIEWNTTSDGSGTKYITNYTSSGNGSITLYAIWQAKPTLYSVLENEATSGSGLAQTYTGAHQDSCAGTGAENIYYYNATSDANATTILDKNNVIFAGFCWQMLRTTDTGGVKIIYNGEVVDGQCLNTRADHVGYGSRTSTSLSSTYYYGTSYTYNGSMFSLAGETKSAKWSDSTYQDLIGWYTCKSSSETGTCSTLYYIESYYTSSSAYVLTLSSGYHYSTIGEVEFNANYNSPSYVGYMYNKVYPSISKSDLRTRVSMLYRTSLSTNYYYADEAVYGSPTASRYNLVSPYKVTSTSEYSSLVGKYTFLNTTETYTSSSVYYIADVSGSYMYYIILSSGKSLAGVDTSYVFGDSYEDNGDGTYTLTNPVTVKKSEWYGNYESLKGKYTCNSASTTCSNPLYVSSGSNYEHMDLVNPANNYKYANSFTYEDGKYYLSGTEQTFFDWSSNYNKLGNTHYTCWNTSGECETISYIYDSGITGTAIAQYINLTGGKGVEEALEDMLSADDVNTTNSTIKSAIDGWYQANMLSYSSYLEDTVFCNDRSIRSLNGWNPNGGSMSSSLQFKEYNVTSDLSCSNATDRFSVSNAKAQLTYPVGLATSPEMNLLGNNALRASGEYYWLASPTLSIGSHVFGRYVGPTGGLGERGVDSSFDVRPSVSLAPGTEYSSGDGSIENPYVVKTITTGIPVGTIIVNNSQAPSETVTLSMTDDTGVSAYYFGTNSNPSASDYTEIETTILAVINETVDNNGAYYLFVKDAAGNTSNTSAEFYKIILETEIGNIASSTIIAKSGSKVNLPIPATTGYSFDSWNTVSDGSGTEYTTSYTGTGNGSMTLYAQWVEDNESPSATITSTNNQASIQTVTLNMTDNIGVNAYYFGTNSNPGISDYTEIESTILAVINETVDNNGTYYLFVKDGAGNTFNTSVEFYKVILDSTVGSVTPTSIVAKSGNEITLPTPIIPNGATFLSWNTVSDGSGTEYTTSYIGTGNGSTNLYAQWVKENELPSATITSTNNQASSQTVTLNMTDNIGVNAYYFGTNSNPGISDYTEIESTTLAVINETVDNNGTYYLFVKDAVGNTFNTSVEFYKVILDPTVGSVTPTSIVAKSGNEITLPTPTNSDGSTFLSWNTVSDGSGTEYTTSYIGTGNGSTNLYAIWDIPGISLYSVLENEVASGSGLAQTYTGAHQDSYAGTGTENIYYYNATSDANATTILDKNNVIFAGFCWQMFRTTDTGGVKIIYSGEAVNGKCLNTSTSIGNVAFNKFSNSLSYVGYMYNSKYLSKSLYTLEEEIIVYDTLLPLGQLENYYFADEYIIDVDASAIELVDSYQLSSINNYEDLIGKYIVSSDFEVEEGKYFMAFCIGAIDENYIYASFPEEFGGNPYEIGVVFGDDYVDNGNGTYTLTNPVTTNKSEWLEIYESLDGNYMCLGTSATCNDIYIASTYESGLYYQSMLVSGLNSNLYANSFVYNENEGKYYLSGDQQTIPDLLSDYSNLSNMHYTCWNSTGSCERISYIYNTLYGENLYYIELSGGNGVEDALEEMFSSNTTDSTIKQVIDDWYQSNLLSYTNYLEDTVFCNDRSIRSLGGWDPNGGDIESYLNFKEDIVTSDLSCSNETDRFSLSNPKAQLTYPIGLATSPEMNLLGNANLRTTGITGLTGLSYWLASPKSFFNYYATGRFVDAAGYFNSDYVDTEHGVRPAVSLAPGTEYSSGDGSMANPYVIKMTTGGGTTEDNESPSATITSTNNQASSQTVTLNMTDNIGVSAYYFGTNSTPSASDYTEIEATTLAIINETVSNNGTYYLFVKDASGNTFNTSVDFYKVVLDTNGYNVSVSPTSIVAMSGNTIELPQIYLAIYLSDWCTNSSGSGTVYHKTYTGSGNSSIILYAQFGVSSG